MKKLLNDIKAASAFFKDLRRHKPDDDIRVYPCMVMGYTFLNTVEGCVLFNCGKEMFDKVSDFFETLPHDVRESFCFSPQNGEYIERAIFWRQALKLVLSEKEYQIAVGKILHWYIHCKKLKAKGAQV